MVRLLRASTRSLWAALAALAVGNAWGQASSARTADTAAQRVLYDGAGGVTCTHYMAETLPWQRRGGDWRDALGLAHGPAPFAQANASAPATIWNVTQMVRDRLATGQTQLAFFLRTLAGSGYATFHSREARDITDRPMLALQFNDGSRQILGPSADTHIDCSTAYSVGSSEKLIASDRHHPVLAFRLPEDLGRRGLARAELILIASARPSGTVNIGVFEVMAPVPAAGSVRLGLAQRFPMDRGIEKHADVVFAARFDTPELLARGWRKESHGDMQLTQADPALGFVPLDGAALRIRMKKGEHLGSDLRLNLRDFGPEPEELYFRYYLRLADDWRPNVASGKLPGFAGTYGKAGWGGRPTDGTEGWSLRGSFTRSFEPGHPFAELTQIGTYAYHAGMRGGYGDIWQWPGALIARNRWYCVEQFVRLNRVGADDGILRVWIDGRQVFENTQLRLRTVESLRIETVWINIYHGGTEPSPRDMSLYIDNVVVARSYIGPMLGALSIR